MVTRILDEEDRKHLELLREYGLEEMAQRYEASLRGEQTVEAKLDPLPDPIPGSVSVTEAAATLGLTSKEIRRHVELGLLSGDSDLETGELLITNTSIVLWLDWKRRFVIIAQPLPGEIVELPDPNSLLGRLFALDDDSEGDDVEG